MALVSTIVYSTYLSAGRFKHKNIPFCDSHLSGDRKTLALALLWRLHGFLKTKLGVGAVAVCLSKLDGLYGR